MFIFELLVQWLGTAVVYRFGSRFLARRRRNKVTKGGLVIVPARIRLGPDTSQTFEVKLYVSLNDITAETTMGLPRKFDLAPTSAVSVADLQTLTAKQWADVVVIKFLRQEGPVAVSCRPQDVSMLSLALNAIAVTDGNSSV